MDEKMKRVMGMIDKHECLTIDCEGNPPSIIVDKTGEKIELTIDEYNQVIKRIFG